jgi:hypothetical protein
LYKNNQVEGTIQSASVVSIQSPLDTDTAISNLNLSTTYDAYGAAATAEQNAKDYADGLAGNYDAAGTANTLINALTTDDIEEGTFNHYYTDGRAKDAAGDLLANATKTNISISYNDVTRQLTVEAENGVADSTTDDLTEGETNLYFQDSRVLTAINNEVITPNVVEISDYRREEATQQTVASASTVDVHSIAYPYESVKYLVRVVGWAGGVKHSQVSEILMTVDGNKNIAITEYGTICTDESPLATFSARSWTGSSDFSTLTATTAVSGCEIIAAATMLSWVD